MKELLYRIADDVQSEVKRCLANPDYAEEIGIGEDGTATKRIDKVAEDAALRSLSKNGSNLNVLSEEAGFVDRGGDETLVIDPIDGTYNAITGIPFYSVSLAVGKQQLSRVHAGLVRNLVTGYTYYAEKGMGAQADGREIKVRPFHAKDAVFSIYMGILADRKTCAVAKQPRRVRSLGCASLEMCLVAEGKMDMYHIVTEGKNHSMRVTDIAASTLILREAGGEVYSRHMTKLDMELDLGPRVSVIAVGDKKALGVIA